MKGLVVRSGVGTTVFLAFGLVSLFAQAASPPSLLPPHVDYTDVIIAAASFGLFVVAFFQLLTFNRQAKTLDLQRDTLHRQAETLEEQRRLMKATLTNAQDTDRAWISIETLEIEFSRGRNAVIFIGLKNSGRTPAKISNANVTLRSTTSRKDEGGGTVIEDLTDLPEVPDYDAGDFVPPAILVAGETTRWSHKVTAPTDGAWNLLTLSPGEEGKFWIYGYVEYTDQFHPSKTRTYRWGREYDPVLSAMHQRFKFAHMSKRDYGYAD